MKKLISAMFFAVLAATAAMADALDTTLFSKKSEMTISGYAGSSTLENFPVLVRLAAGSPSGFAYADVTNGDLRFADASGNSLPFEIETWNPSGESHIWVSVPSLSGKTTKITMYYGATSGKLPAVDASGVWKNAGYVNVLHFSTASGLQNIDSTENALSIARPNATANATEAAGLLTGAIKNESQSQLGLKVEANAAWNWSAGAAVTVSAWGKRTRDTSDRVLFGTTDLKVSVNGDTAKATVNGVTTTAAVGTVGDWNLYTLVADGTSVRLYVNGVAGNPEDGAVTASSSAFIWGSDGSSRWKGTFDEARLRHGADSADWAKACYDTIASADFVTSSAVEAQATTAPTFVNTFSGTPVEADKFSSRLDLTLAGYTGSDALENLPVLVRLNAITAAGFDVTTLAADGSNFRFADAQGNNLPFEIDTWDTTSGRNVWVTVPYVEGATTKIYLYFGTTAALAANDPTKTWTDAGYRNVMHFQTAKAEKGAFDSSGYADSISVQAATVVSTANGKIGEGSNNAASGATGYQFSLAGGAQWTKGAPVTFSLWALVTDGQRPLFGDSVAGGVYSIYATADKKIWAVAGKETAAANAVGVNVLPLPGGVAANTWAHYTFVCEGSVTKVYVNGAYQGMVSTPLPNMKTFNWCAANGGNRLKGNADEVRLHLGAESADYVAASYAAMNDANFLVAGSVGPAVTEYRPEILSTAVNGNRITVTTRLTAFADGASSVTLTLLYGTSAESLTSELALGVLTEPDEFTKTIAGLNFSQQYYLKVKAVDNLSNEAFSSVVTATTGEDPRLDPTLLQKYSTITVGGYAGSTTLANFPVLVKLAEGSPVGFTYDDCKNDGSDLRFTDASGVTIPHEVETWDVNGTSCIWVCVPEVSGTTTEITMYFGCDDTSVLPTVNESEVWTKSGHNAVWHFADSTKESAQGIVPTTTVGTLGYTTVEGGGVGKSLLVDGNQTLGFANDAKWATLGEGNALTLSLWTKCDASAANYARMLSCMSSWGNKTGWEFTIQSAINQITVGSSAQSQFQYNISPSPGAEMVYLAAVYHANKDVALFVNGAQVYSKALNQLVTPAETLWIASCDQSKNRWKGKLDEIRIHRTDESADWLAASYATMKNASFVTMAEVQSTSSTVPLSVKTTGFVQEGDTATVYGRLANLGTGATEAAVKLFWGTSPTVDDTCASVDLGTFTDKANLEATLNDLEPAETYYAAFRAINNVATPETAWSSVVSFTVDASTKISDELVVVKNNCKMTVNAPIVSWGVGTTKAELLVGTSAETLTVKQTIDGMTEKPQGGAICFDPVQLGVGTYVYVIRTITTYGDVVWTNTTTTANSVALTDAATYTWKGGTGAWSDTTMWTTSDDGAAGSPTDGCSAIFGDGASDVTITTYYTLANLTVSSVGTHAFRTQNPQTSYTLKAQTGGHFTVTGAGQGRFVADSVIFENQLEGASALSEIVIAHKGRVYPSTGATTDVTLVNGGHLYNGGTALSFGKLTLVGGPGVLSSSQYTQHGFTFASFEVKQGSGVPVVSVASGRVTFTDPSGIETVGGTASLTDATSTIPVCPNFQISNGKLHGHSACTIDGGIIKVIPGETMKDTLEDVSELDNVYLGADYTLDHDVTVNALIFNKAKINLGGHVVTVRSGVFREGENGMWNTVISNGIVRLCRPNALGDSTNNTDVRCRVEIETDGNTDPNVGYLAHNCEGGGWDTVSTYTNFVGTFATPYGVNFAFSNSHRSPKAAVEMRGGTLGPSGHSVRANFKGLSGVGVAQFSNWSTLVWFGDVGEEEKDDFDALKGRVVIGNNGFLRPGYVDYDGGRRGKFSFVYCLPQGTLSKLDALEFRNGASLDVTLRKDGTCSYVDATSSQSETEFLSVVAAGSINVTTVGRIPSGVGYPIVRYRGGKLSGRFSSVTPGYKVAYDVPLSDGSYAVTVTRKQPGTMVILR